MIDMGTATAWLRTLLFVAGNLTVGLGITFACILPARDFLGDRDQEIVQLRVTLSRLRAIAAQEAEVQSAARENAVDHNEFLSGKNEGGVAADLQTRLKGMVEAAGGKLRSIRTLQAQTDEQTKYIGSRIELFGPLQAIHRAIHAIESAKPYLFVRGAVIKPSPPMGQIGIPQEPVIEAQLDVFGAMRVEAGER